MPEAADHEGDGSGPAAPAGLYRIGAVSRLSGVPVTTLRVWESRYGAFAPGKSSGRHRLYQDADVIKARLVRQLADAGHSVGRIAPLPMAQLQQMLAQATSRRGTEAPPRGTGAPRVTAVIVGAGIAARVNAPGWQHRHLGELLHVPRVYVDLAELEAEAARAGQQAASDLLIVKLNTIHPGVMEQLTRALAQLRAGRAIVLYNYGAEAVVRAMQSAGMIVRREPVADAEFAQLIRALRVVDPVQSLAGFNPGSIGMIPPRRYSDATLARVAVSPNTVVCECPRHIAELIGQLSSFEEYSERCLNDTAEDAQVHALLRSISGSARALFEHALQVVAQHGGLELEEAPVPDAAVPAT